MWAYFSFFLECNQSETAKRGKIKSQVHFHQNQKHPPPNQPSDTKPSRATATRILRGGLPFGVQAHFHFQFDEFLALYHAPSFQPAHQVCDAQFQPIAGFHVNVARSHANILVAFSASVKHKRPAHTHSVHHAPTVHVHKMRLRRFYYSKEEPVPIGYVPILRKHHGGTRGSKCRAFVAPLPQLG